jgi:hypothetical protein
LRGPGRTPADPLSHPLGLLVFAAPFVALALLADRGGFASQVHLDVLGAARVAQEAGTPGGIGFAYPPLPRLIALAFAEPDALAVLAAVLGGAALWFVWRRLAARGTPWWLRLALVVSVGASPGYGYLMTQTLPRAAAIFLFTVALDGFFRFTIDGETAGGFRCGLLLGLAFFVDFYAILFAVGLGLAAVPFVRHRLRGPGLTRATVAVILFPAVGAAVVWAFAEWSQSGAAFASLSDPRLSLSWFPNAADAARGLGGLELTGRELLCTPVFLVAGMLLARRVRIWVLALLVAPLMLALTRYVGSAYIPFSTITLGLIGCLTVPAYLKRWERGALLTACVAQVALLWTIAPTTGEFHEWAGALQRYVGW